MSINEKIQRTIGKVKLGAKKNAPELCLIGAAVTGTACVATSIIATTKLGKINDNKDKSLEEIMESYKNITDEVEMKKEIRKVYFNYAFDLVKNYSIPAGLYASTILLIFKSYKIQKNRQIALSTALTACTTAYNALVTKLKTGAEYGLTAKQVLDGVEVKEVVDEETGEVKTELYQGAPIEYMYKFRFDKYSECWEKSKLQNESTLRCEENWANDMLQLRGYVFLNDVLDRLGLPKTPAGQFVGWKLNGEGDNYVDFRIKDCSEYDNVKYDENAFDLDFNVDGDILNCLEK